MHIKSPIAIKPLEPALGPNPDFSRVIYPNAPSHDFCVWLIIAETMRRYHGAAGPLKVKLAFSDDQLGKADWGDLSIASGQVHPCGVSKEYSERMLEGIIRPAIDMIGAIEEAPAYFPLKPGEASEYVEYDYHIGHLVDAGRQGYEIPKWKVPHWAREEVKGFLGSSQPIVITLREVEDIQPARNSLIHEWLQFAMWAEGAGYDVIFVRDTSKAMHKLPFKTYPRASTNAYIRAALYQRALVNMMVCNGPNTWCIFSDAPYLIFKELVPELPAWDHGNAKGWRDQDHMEIGDQYAWGSPLQRLTWVEDRYDMIMVEFQDFLIRRKEWLMSRS